MITFQRNKKISLSIFGFEGSIENDKINLIPIEQQKPVPNSTKLIQRRFRFWKIKSYLWNVLWHGRTNFKGSSSLQSFKPLCCNYIRCKYKSSFNVFFIIYHQTNKYTIALRIFNNMILNNDPFKPSNLYIQTTRTLKTLVINFNMSLKY